MPNPTSTTSPGASSAGPPTPEPGDLRDPAAGKVLFRFTPPEPTSREAAMWDICPEYVVTDFKDEGSGWCPPPDHCRLIVWGLIRGKWEANVNARPVIYELLKRLRETEES